MASDARRTAAAMIRNHFVEDFEANKILWDGTDLEGKADVIAELLEFCAGAARFMAELTEQNAEESLNRILGILGESDE